MMLIQPLMVVQPVFADDTGIDEIHAQFGDNAQNTVWVQWRGPANNVYYGPTTAYGSTSAMSTAQPITPTDTTGPFMRVQLTGLTANTEYHYKIGSTGLDHTFKTAPGRNDNFTWIDIGDTATTYYNTVTPASECDKPWMGEVWPQLASENPDFVTHGGDISYANDCGPGAIHQFYQDIAPIATKRVFMQVWGNHEYGPVSPEAQSLWGSETNDSYANYKGRNFMPNAQALANNTPTQNNPPGCGTGGVNTCPGNDYGYFDAGGVRFLMLPENHYNAYNSTGDGSLTSGWAQYADGVMAAAQNDPNIDMVVTLSHQPAYSSLFSTTNGDFAYNEKLRPVLDALGDKYSPSSTVTTGGKYVLEVNHHIHGAEMFSPRHGVWHVTNGGGGTERTDYSHSPDVGSIFRDRSPSHLKVTKSGTTMNLQFICGPVFGTATPTCTKGDVMFTQQISTSPVAPNPPADQCSGSPAAAGQEYVMNRSVEGTNAIDGWTGVTTGASQVSVDNQNACDGYNSLKVAVESGTSPSNVGFNSSPTWVSAGESTETVAGDSYVASVWAKSSTTNAKIKIQLQEKNAAGTVVSSKIYTEPTASTAWHKVSMSTSDPFVAAGSGNSIAFKVRTDNPSPSTTFNADQMSLVKVPSGSVIPPQSVCSDSTSNELVSNRSVESSMEGWGGVYSPSSSVGRVGTEACEGSYSLKIDHNGGTSAAFGFVNSPQYVNGTTTATDINATYNAGVYIKGATGAEIKLVLQEKRPDGTVVDTQTSSVTLANTSWQQLTGSYQASEAGNALTYKVYQVDPTAGTTFYADNMSISYTPGDPTLTPQYACSVQPAIDDPVANPSFEDNLDHWDIYGSVSATAMHIDGVKACDGVRSMRATYTDTSKSKFGVQSDEMVYTNGPTQSNSRNVNATVNVKTGIGTVLTLRITEYALVCATDSVCVEQEIGHSGTSDSWAGTSWRTLSASYTTPTNYGSYNMYQKYVKLQVYAANYQQAGGNIPPNAYFYLDRVNVSTNAPVSLASSDVCTESIANNLIGNKSVEGGLGQWNSTYNTSSYIERDNSKFASACDGIRSVKTRLKDGVTSAAAAGFVSGSPYLVPNATVLGKSYKGRAWVRTPIGKEVVAVICERDASGCKQTLTNSYPAAVTTQWRPIETQALTSAMSGRSIMLKFYVKNPNQYDWMYADMFSLTEN